MTITLKMLWLLSNCTLAKGTYGWGWINMIKTNKDTGRRLNRKWVIANNYLTSRLWKLRHKSIYAFRNDAGLLFNQSTLRISSHWAINMMINHRKVGVDSSVRRRSVLQMNWAVISYTRAVWLLLSSSSAHTNTINVCADRTAGRHPQAKQTDAPGRGWERRSRIQSYATVSVSRHFISAKGRHQKWL